VCCVGGIKDPEGDGFGWQGDGVDGVAEYFGWGQESSEKDGSCVGLGRGLADEVKGYGGRSLSGQDRWACAGQEQSDQQ
jgi:hypothetical protein